jgi:hypothetical protein
MYFYYIVGILVKTKAKFFLIGDDNALFPQTGKNSLQKKFHFTHKILLGRIDYKKPEVMGKNNDASAGFLVRSENTSVQ